MARKVLIRNGLVLDDLGRPGRFTTQDVLIEGRCVAAVARHMPIPDGAQTIDAEGGIVLAGMTDTHRHTWQAVVRGICGDMTAVEYYKSVRWGVAQSFTPDDVHLGTLVGALEMVNAGVTQVVDFSHCMNSPSHADAAYQALVDSGMRATLSYGFNAVPLPKPHFATHAERLDDFRRVHRTYGRKSPLISLGVALSDFALTGLDTLRTEIMFARELGVPITFHPGALRPKTRYGTITLLNNAGLLGPDMNLAHCTNATEDELLMLGDSGAWVSCTPEPEMQMGMGFSAVGKLLKLGMKPTLGVDVVSACSGDLITQARMALQAERALRQVDGMAASLDLTARDMLRIATEYGAEKVGSHGVDGRVVPGSVADLMVLKPSLFELNPIVDPCVAVLLHSTPATVDTVIVDGRILKQDGKLAGVDVAALRARATEVGNRVVGIWAASGGLAAAASDTEEVTRSRLAR